MDGTRISINWRWGEFQGLNFQRSFLTFFFADRCLEFWNNFVGNLDRYSVCKITTSTHPIIAKIPYYWETDSDQICRMIVEGKTLPVKKGNQLGEDLPVAMTLVLQECWIPQPEERSDMLRISTLLKNCS